MPKGMRESLYIKDDDYSMSFSCGNFVTLTNLSDEGLDRIIRLHLSPLYLSVHTMNPDLRVKLLRNRFAGKIVEQVKKLAEGGIELHCQAVLVPNENDGKELAYTARELFKYYPIVRDLACVPTGLTKYRDGLYPIADVDKAYSEKLLDLVDGLNKEFGVNFLLPADEYFVKAERGFKDEAFYGDFEQIGKTAKGTDKYLINQIKGGWDIGAGPVAVLPKRWLLNGGKGKLRSPRIRFKRLRSGRKAHDRRKSRRYGGNAGRHGCGCTWCKLFFGSETIARCGRGTVAVCIGSHCFE